MRLGIAISILLFVVCALGEEAEFPLKTEDIHIRDPFIVTDTVKGCYYLYSSTGRDGVQVHVGKDLKNWSQPKRVMAVPEDWGCSAVWAPEVHHYNGAYYLFTTLTFNHAKPVPPKLKDGWNMPLVRRGTYVFKSVAPDGPFLPLKSSVSHTPQEWLALDGTLCVEDGRPYMVFCHEWVQIQDGTIDLMPLKNDLSDADGKPSPLFAASIAPGGETDPAKGKVTDGPFLHRSAKNGALYMIWSTFLPKDGGYCVMLSRSDTGHVAGPWKTHTPLYKRDGGHGMIFTALDGRLLLALHQPNSRGMERLHLFELEDTGTTLRLK